MAKKTINNKLLIVLSLAVAVIIWMYVIIAEDPVTTAKVGPLTIQYTTSVPMQQKDIEIIGELSEKVELTVKGSRSYVTGSKANYSAVIDLSQISQSASHAFRYPQNRLWGYADFFLPRETECGSPLLNFRKNFLS